MLLLFLGFFLIFLAVAAITVRYSSKLRHRVFYHDCESDFDAVQCYRSREKPALILSLGVLSIGIVLVIDRIFFAGDPAPKPRSARSNAGLIFQILGSAILWPMICFVCNKRDSTKLGTRTVKSPRYSLEDCENRSTLRNVLIFGAAVVVPAACNVISLFTRANDSRSSFLISNLIMSVMLVGGSAVTQPKVHGKFD